MEVLYIKQDYYLYKAFKTSSGFPPVTCACEYCVVLNLILRLDIFGIASSLVVLHRGAGLPSASLPWPMCQERPVQQQLPLPVALSGTEAVSREDAFPLPSLSLCTCLWLRAVKCMCTKAKLSLHGCCEVQLPPDHAHTASHTINQVSGNSLISYWGTQPGKLGPQ